MQQNCEACGDHPATVRCLECAKNALLCSDCFTFLHKSDAKKAHKSCPVTESDKAVATPPIIYPCSIHGQERRYICKGCNKTACSDCIAIGEHKGHDVVLFCEADKHVESQYGTLVKEYGALLDSIKGIEAGLLLKEQKFAASLEKAKEDVRKKFDEVMAMMQAKKDKIMEFLDEGVGKGLHLEAKVAECKSKIQSMHEELILKKGVTPDEYDKLGAMRISDLTKTKKYVSEINDLVTAMPENAVGIKFDVGGIDSFVRPQAMLAQANEDDKCEFRFVKTESPYLALSDGGKTAAITGRNDCNQTTYVYCWPPLSAHVKAKYSISIKIGKTGSCGAKRFGLLENNQEILKKVATTVEYMSLNASMVAFGEGCGETGRILEFKSGDIYKLEVDFCDKKVRVTGKDSIAVMPIRDIDYVLFCGACCPGNEFTIGC